MFTTTPFFMSLFLTKNFKFFHLKTNKPKSDRKNFRQNLNYLILILFTQAPIKVENFFSDKNLSSSYYEDHQADQRREDRQDAQQREDH